jgi:hypothetical protein
VAAVSGTAIIVEAVKQSRACVPRAVGRRHETLVRLVLVPVVSHRESANLKFALTDWTVHVRMAILFVDLIGHKASCLGLMTTPITIYDS